MQRVSSILNHHQHGGCGCGQAGFWAGRSRNTYVCEAVEACKELVEHPHQLLRRQRGGEVGEAFDICEQDAEKNREMSLGCPAQL